MTFDEARGHGLHAGRCGLPEPALVGARVHDDDVDRRWIESHGGRAVHDIAIE
jgi:hypothetical protein